MGLQFDAIAAAPHATAQDAGPVVAFEDFLTPLPMILGKMRSFRTTAPTMVRRTVARRWRYRRVVTAPVPPRLLSYVEPATAGAQGPPPFVIELLSASVRAVSAGPRTESLPAISDLFLRDKCNEPTFTTRQRHQGDTARAFAGAAPFRTDVLFSPDVQRSSMPAKFRRCPLLTSPLPGLAHRKHPGGDIRGSHRIEHARSRVSRADAVRRPRRGHELEEPRSPR